MKKVVTTATGPACLTLRWVRVTSGGRTHLEMRWSAPTVVRRTTHAA